MDRLGLSLVDLTALYEGTLLDVIEDVCYFLKRSVLPERQLAPKVNSRLGESEVGNTEKVAAHEDVNKVVLP